MKSLKIFLLIFTTAFTFSNHAQAQVKNNWRFIGDKNVNFRVDRDVIVFGNVKDNFRQLQIRVTDGPLRMLDMKIFFDNGEVQNVALKANFAPGDVSRVIDFKGRSRNLRKIEFAYVSKGYFKGRARVAVWGRK